ncbi:GNAT family N-acetyltransferase [Hahella aquimaris]|uniref:GNAT family N-acetyltransferase n=1 Tax=Hahella sp. HNIBRBA332 TaxID=3015983 RepID=UPI00273C761C|nr:GNAT family N-acetyltransferase [Hahella sp. HNIBRBA332]WLQ16321.1 GNAT family N-acetyltransferase [Hahella sp. HNIBRBA332]
MATPNRVAAMKSDPQPHILLVTAIPASELESCDFSFEITHEIVFPYHDAESTRPICRRRKEYGFDPASAVEESSGRTALFAARVEKRLVGFALIIESWNGMAEIAEIAVDRNARGQGVGMSLLSAAEDWARQQGFRFIRLETQSTNPAACKLYARAGYSLEGFDRMLYANSENEGETALFWYRSLGEGAQILY